LIDDVRRAGRPVIIEKAGVPVAAIVAISAVEGGHGPADDPAARLVWLRRLRRRLAGVISDEMERELARTAGP
jgi:antitoxin (DNA-binding transcriptional repressor) of toxin-antitoxin stability system